MKLEARLRTLVTRALAGMGDLRVDIVVITLKNGYGQSEIELPRPDAGYTVPTCTAL